MTPFTLVDTHSHLHFSDFKNDIDAVLDRARAAGVALIVVGTLQKTSTEAVVFAQAHEHIWAAIGLHPNNIHEIHPNEDEGSGSENFDYEFYKNLARNDKVVAIGETGMDFFRIPDGLDRTMVIADQEKIFRRHLDLCDELNKPVIIHCRDAHDEVIAVLTEYITAGKLARRGVLHCFTGSAEQGARYVSLGMYISIPGIITFPPKKSEHENSLNAVVRTIPRDRLLVETDCPYLTPVPHRGERNESAYVIHTVQKIAEILNASFEEIARETSQNARALFQIE